MREGRNESEGDRGVLVETGERGGRRSALVAEVERLAADKQDRAARAELMAYMDAVTSDRPA